MTNRVAYYTNDSFYEGGGYLVAKVTENEAGYEPGWERYSSVPEAQTVADQMNSVLGVTRDDVLNIVASSMRQPGSVRR